MPPRTSVSHFEIISKAWPIILANLSVPLLGLADTAVIGNTGSVEDLGAIALGSLIFSFVYWSFGFLRMGTTSFVAQANGASNEAEVRAALGRALIIALIIGVFLIAIQFGIKQLALALLQGSELVEREAGAYFSIRIWGAPATMATFALMGLLIGLGYSKQLLLVQLILNGSNILLDLWFAGALGMGARGIALGTLIAEWTALGFALLITWKCLQGRHHDQESFWVLTRLKDTARLMQTVTANSDIMIRTLLMIFSFAWFINQSAGFGDAVLAANHILLQLISFSAFFLDGFAFVVESMVGAAVGRQQRDLFDQTVIKSSQLALFTALLLAVLLLVAGEYFVLLLADIESVQAQASQYLQLTALYVLLACAAFQLDGIFIGAGWTRQMRNASFISVSVYLLAWWVLIEPFGVSGLWVAMIIYVCARALALLIFYPGLRKSIALTS